MSEKLELCPFCGCTIIELTEEHHDTLPGTFFAVKCANCPALMELSDRDHVVDRWNRRAGSERRQLEQAVIEAARPLPMFEGPAHEHGRLLVILRQRLAALDAKEASE